MAVYRLVLGFIIFGNFSSCLFAHDKCTQADARVAEEESDSITSWQQLHHAFLKYRWCDDGAIGEGYSDSVAKLLTEQWQGISQLQKIFNSDKYFEVFVLKHIDELMTPSQFAQIESNAANHCPERANEFCHKITDRIGEIRSATAKMQPTTR